MSKLPYLITKYKTFFHFYLSIIAACSTFDFVAIPTSLGNLKLAFILCLPLIFLIDFIEIKKFLIYHRWVLIGTLASLLLSIKNSYDLGNSIKWCLQLFMDIFLFLSLYNALKLLKSIQPIFFKTLMMILLPGLIQWLCIKLNIYPPFLSQTDEIFFRLNGFSFYPNFFTVSISLFLPLFLFDKSSQERLRISIIVFLCAFVLIQSTARTGYLTLFIFTLTRFFLPKFNIANTAKAIGPIILALAISLLIPEKNTNQANTTGFDKISHFAEGIKLNPGRGSPQERICIAKQGINVFSDHFLWGVGPFAYENFMLTLDNENQQKYNPHPDYETFYHHENIWIELFTNNGALFSFLLAFFLLSILKNNITKVFYTSPGVIISLLTYYIVSGQFVQNILFPGTFVIWSIFAYTIFGKDQKLNDPQI